MGCLFFGFVMGIMLVLVQFCFLLILVLGFEMGD